MKFSDVFGIKVGQEDDWFDPVLSLDTPLFIDPFLIFDNEDGLFIGSHAEIISYFDSAFKLLASSNGNPSSPAWTRVESMMLFPEAHELCLGFASEDTGGAGSGRGFAAQITAALWKAIELGKQDLNHFEQVQLFQKGIGRDRISDATANIIRDKIATYTANISHRHGLKCSLARYDRGLFSTSDGRWKGRTYQLPKNPYTGRHILLVPKHFLRDLPTINKDDFWDYCVHNENALLRDMFGTEILRKADAAAIIKVAISNPAARERYIAYREEKGSDPYDLLNDPRGFVEWYQQSRDWVADHPLRLKVQGSHDFLPFLQRLIDEFRNWVENNKGWSLLWNDNKTAKGEDATQNLFLGITKHYCAASDIDVSKEVNIGRGPVDFKFSSGYHDRALLEVKLVNNSRFWNGLEAQLPKYLQSEGISHGFFLPVILRDQDVDKLSDIESRIRTLNAQLPYRIGSIAVDARRNPLSASKLR